MHPIPSPPSLPVARLVSFLGIAWYDVAAYRSTRPGPPHVIVTCLNDAVSIYDLAEPDEAGRPTRRVEVVVVGTKDVRKKWFIGPLTPYEVQLRRAVLCELDEREEERRSQWREAFYGPPEGPAPGPGPLAAWLDAGLVTWSFVEIPSGGNPTEHWRIFETVAGLLTAGSGPLRTLCRVSDTAEARAVDSVTLGEPEVSMPSCIAVDITNGYRSQPFFASAALGFAQQEAALSRAGASAPPLVRVGYVVYAPDLNKVGDNPMKPVYEAVCRSCGAPTRVERVEEKRPAPVEHRDLTQTLSAFAWTSAITALMRYGRGDELAEQLEAYRPLIAEEAEREHADAFSNAVKDFADALCLLRVPPLVTKHAAELARAVESFAPHARASLPPLVPQLDRLAAWARDLQAPTIVSPEGLRVQARLARLAHDLGRYAESIAIVREGLISAWALRRGRSAVLQPEQRGFDRHRAAVERSLGAYLSRVSHTTPDTANNEARIALSFRVATRIRNDILHCAFREQPIAVSSTRDELVAIIGDFQALLAGLAPEPIEAEGVDTQIEEVWLIENFEPTMLSGAGRFDVRVERLRSATEVKRALDGRPLRFDFADAVVGDYLAQRLGVANPADHTESPSPPKLAPGMVLLVAERRGPNSTAPWYLVTVG